MFPISASTAVASTAPKHVCLLAGLLCGSRSHAPVLEASQTFYSTSISLYSKGCVIPRSN